MNRDRLVAGILGGLFALQGLGKLADMAGYQRDLEAFEWPGGISVVLVSWVWMLLELGGGLLVLGGQRPASARRGLGWGIGVLLGLSLAYTALNGRAYWLDLPIGNCTCFGVFAAQPLSAFVLFQDVVVVAWAAFVLRGHQRRRG